MSNIFSIKTISSVTSRIESMIYQQMQQLISLQAHQNYQLVEVARRKKKESDDKIIFQCEIEYKTITDKKYPDKEILAVFDYSLVNYLKITIKEAFLEKNNKQSKIPYKDPNIINKIIYQKCTIENHKDYITIFASDNNKLRNITEYYMDKNQKIWSYDEIPDLIQNTIKPLLLRQVLVGIIINGWITTTYLTENKLKNQIFLKGESLNLVKE